MDDKLCWYVLLNEGMFIGYTNSEYVANKYKNCYDLSDISIIKYESSKEVVEQITFEKYGCKLNEVSRIKSITTLNNKLVVLASEHWIDDCLYSGIMDDLSHDVDALVVALYNLADFLDYFADGDKLRVVIKIMIIKYIKEVMDIYYGGGPLFKEPPVDTLYLLAYNNAIPIIGVNKGEL